MAADFRDTLIKWLDDRMQTYTEMSDAIWEFAEPRFEEYESSKLQQEYLASRGFAVKADLAGEKTAFIAEYGSGKPVIAFLGEFDSLSALQQEADKTEHCPIEGKKNGHGCGHHLLGTGAVAAVDALWRARFATMDARQRRMQAVKHIWYVMVILMTVTLRWHGTRIR